VTGANTVSCTVSGLRAQYDRDPIRFGLGTDLVMQAEGELGGRGLSPAAADLVDLGAAVYQIERQLRGRQRTNPPVRFELQFPLRDPGSWTDRARMALGLILAELGNAQWDIVVRPRRDTQVPVGQRAPRREVDQVILLSGGLDSASGAAASAASALSTCLVSFYTRQKTVQRNIAARLGYPSPVQWRMSWSQRAGRGHTFRYRSFFFLCLAVAVADSWGARRVLQYENGVLATAVPPGPSWFMTRHAYPAMQEQMAVLAGEVLGGAWTVDNPFLRMTKRQGLEAARQAVGTDVMNEVAAQTETCWFHWSNRIVGGKKTPGVPCGVCIPCLVRRTALPNERYCCDLRDDQERNDPYRGRAFRAYYGFLHDVRGAGGSLGEFYRLLPAAGRELYVRGFLTLQEMDDLFRRFADEFMGTFEL
jgi:7-cyano-7-deazaguanine synthase in queuosine biosynthesis